MSLLIKNSVKAEENKIIIKPHMVYCIVAAFCILVGLICGVAALDCMAENDYGLAAITGVGFAVLLLFAFWLLVVYGGTVVLDEDGVHSRFGFIKKTLMWSEIEDYGFSKDDTLGKKTQLLTPMYTYDLYFAAEKQQNVTYGTKRLKGKMIRRRLTDSQIGWISETVVDFCKRYTSVRPFDEGILKYDETDRIKKTKKNTSMKIKPCREYMFTSVLFLAIPIVLLAVLLPVLKSDENATVLEWAVVIAFFAILLGLGMYAVITSFKTLTIDKNGISSKSVFSKTQVAWSEVRDYGLSYGGETHFDEANYVLYFACEPLKAKKNGKKKFKGKTIRTFVTNEEYSSFKSMVFPFCRKFTDVKPYDAYSRRQEV
ncbi:MAG: hypothetical protein NC110_06945 [Ruminococcus sp.]|nr:hypothetical protein [Ruminococcus sp.]